MLLEVLTGLAFMFGSTFAFILLLKGCGWLMGKVDKMLHPLHQVWVQINHDHKIAYVRRWDERQKRGKEND